MKLIFLGPPGAGKGTIANRIKDRFQTEVITMGQIIKTEIRLKTALGKIAESFVKKGDLVPTDIVVKLLKKNVKEKIAYILDGFPRSIEQARAIHDEIDIDEVIYLHVPDEVLIERLSNRRVCPEGHSYNLKTLPPKQEAKCDIDGKKLELRMDDKPDVIAERLEVYHSQTEPLVQMYKEEDKLITINANRDVDLIVEDVLRLVH